MDKSIVGELLKDTKLDISYAGGGIEVKANGRPDALILAMCMICAQVISRVTYDDLKSTADDAVDMFTRDVGIQIREWTGQAIKDKRDGTNKMGTSIDVSAEVSNALH